MHPERLLNERALALKQGAIRAMFDKANRMENVISMGIGEPDMDTATVICQAAAEGLAKGYTHYTPNAGLPALRKAISELGFAVPGLYAPEEIIVTNGGMGGLSLLMLVILNDGDEVLIQNPQWLNYASQISYCGGVPVAVPADPDHAFSMHVDTIRQYYKPGKTKALIINSPNNPTGHVLGRKELEQIAELAKELDLLIISDEVYNTLLYDGAQAVSMAELPGMKERTIVVNSFSKSYAMTGWRVGYVAAPEQIINRMSMLQENFNSCVNASAQYAAIYALEHKELTQQIRDSLAERRQIVLDGLKEIPGIHCPAPKGAFYLFPDIRAFGLDSVTFCNRLLDEAGVVCIPGSAFGSCGEGYIRICYTTKKEKLPEAMARIKEFCAKLQRDNG